MDPDKIEINDIVSVNFNNSQFTHFSRATVLYIPCATGDSWIFKSCAAVPTISYISEGCTVTLLEKEK